MNGPITDSMKLARLPKWAQARIRDNERRIEDLRKLVDKLILDDKQREDWHNHTIKTSDIVNGKLVTRFFVASSIDIDLDNGLRLDVDPTNDGEIRLYFSLHGGGDGRRADAAIIPGATNALTIKKVYLS
jgi:hypothetical protein